MLELAVKRRQSLCRAAPVGAAPVLVAALIAGLLAEPSLGDLASRYSAGQQRANRLQSTIQSETNRIRGYEGTLANLQERLRTIQRSVLIQQQLLRTVRSQVVARRMRLHELERQYVRDRRVLAAELLAEYESPPPTIVGVIVNSQGFDDLLNRVRNLHAIERHNAAVANEVNTQHREVVAQAQRLAVVQARRQRATAAVLVERDQVAQLRLAVAGRRLAAASARAENTGQLTSLRNSLAREAAALDRQAASAQLASSGGAAVAPGACVSGGFEVHAGPFGFFPAAGTDYSVGDEPLLAARLDALGRALQLHLIGISGYRTPQHSVEVGGFADDPHTQGLASDTPGVEGVAEATLERFCLTRPFGGAAEADHIQPL
jgi:peptidoglycan hydrolase CwlO-like protein